jgi:hypothetical protein
LSDMNEGVERIEDIAKQVLSRLAVNPETDCVRTRLSHFRVTVSCQYPVKLRMPVQAR